MLGLQPRTHKNALRFFEWKSALQLGKMVAVMGSYEPEADVLWIRIRDIRVAAVLQDLPDQRFQSLDQSRHFNLKWKSAGHTPCYLPLSASLESHGSFSFLPLSAYGSWARNARTQVCKLVVPFTKPLQRNNWLHLQYN